MTPTPRSERFPSRHADRESGRSETTEPSLRDQATWNVFREMLSEDGHDNFDGFLNELANFFGDVRIEGRSILEVGSGRGLTSIYAALQGAREVVSLEPELVGSRGGMVSLQQRRIDALQLRTIELIGADFNTWDPGPRRFDILVSQASINHLYASSFNANRDRETNDAYIAVAGKMRTLLHDGGVAIITDACRHAFFTLTRDLGIRRPWDLSRTGVNWRHHQNPGVWRRIFTEAGFSSVRIHYPVPYRLRKLKGLVDTAVPNFFLLGRFILYAWR
jgi:SAM-dependent methyltransferase